ncbi:MAG: hypothetical protein AAGJ31_00435 [Verrucomicrobiota bacterium]
MRTCVRKGSGWLLALFLLDGGAFVVAQAPQNADMSFLENDEVRVGVDLNRGGAIVYLSRDDGENLINNYDLGRQVQLSVFSGPIPFATKGQQPKEHWAHLGWNPIQAGDDFGNGSPVLDHQNDGSTLFVRTRPLQWPLDQVPGDCLFEQKISLDGAVVCVRARLINQRRDLTLYPARHQELPALYGNAPYYRVVSYVGERPFSKEAPAEIPRKRHAPGEHPWSFWLGTEGWSALMNEANWGIGLVTPGRIAFTGGFAGTTGGVNDQHATHTGYLSGLGQDVLDANIIYDCAYELLPGTIEEIRERARRHHARDLPSWEFARSREGWFPRNSDDQGWPVQGELALSLDQRDPQLISPYVFWRAEDAPVVEIECAFSEAATSGLASLYWQRLGEKHPRAMDFVEFPTIRNGKFQRYAVRLAEAASYKGGMVRLRIDPGRGGEAEGEVRIRRVSLKGV